MSFSRKLPEVRTGSFTDKDLFPIDVIREDSPRLIGILIRDLVSSCGPIQPNRQRYNAGEREPDQPCCRSPKRAGNDVLVHVNPDLFVLVMKVFSDVVCVPDEAFAQVGCSGVGCSADSHDQRQEQEIENYYKVSQRRFDSRKPGNEQLSGEEAS